MDGGRANWDEDTTKTFLDLCIREKEKQNYNSRGLTKLGWQNVYRNFKDNTGCSYGTKQLQNKFNTLKRVYRLWNGMKKKTGGGWNSSTESISMDLELWQSEFGDNVEAPQIRNKPLPFKDELTTLFGSTSTDSGTMFCVGGYGETQPSHGSEEYRTPLADENHGSSEEDVGRSGVGRVNKRAGKDHVVDSPPPKRRLLEQCVQRISESMLERSRNESSSMVREQHEVTELLQRVRDDGVAKGSELYYIATELFMKPGRRAAFRASTPRRNALAGFDGRGTI